jgi:hypothetical protein
MALAVITIASGGLPVVDVSATVPKLGLGVSEATNGKGIAVTKVTGKPGLAVTYVVPDRRAMNGVAYCQCIRSVPIAGQTGRRASRLRAHPYRCRM